MSKASLLRSVDRILKRRVTAAASLLEDEAERAFTKKVKVRSKPGEYPAKQTGALVKSVEVNDEDNGMAKTIGPTVHYADDLKEMDRKMMDSVLAENRAAVERILTKG